MAMSVSALLGDHRYATVKLNATAVLQRLLPLVNDTQRLRGLTHRVLSGDVAATAQREEARQALDAGVLAFDAALPSAVSYHLDDAWQPLRQSLRELAACRHAASAPGVGRRSDGARSNCWRGSGGRRRRLDCMRPTAASSTAISTSGASTGNAVWRVNLDERRISELLLVLTHCLTQFAPRRMVRRGQHDVTRQISMTTRKELVEALRVRYGSGAFGERIKILDEFVALTGYHRKHAVRALREEVTKTGAASALRSGSSSKAG